MPTEETFNAANPAKGGKKKKSGPTAADKAQRDGHAVDCSSGVCIDPDHEDPAEKPDYHVVSSTDRPEPMLSPAGYGLGGALLGYVGGAFFGFSPLLSALGGGTLGYFYGASRET